jgi:uncharacterized protein YerC
MRSSDMGFVIWPSTFREATIDEDGASVAHRLRIVQMIARRRCSKIRCKTGLSVTSPSKLSVAHGQVYSRASNHDFA